MRRSLLGGMALVGLLAACGGAGKNAEAKADSAGTRDLQLAPTDTGAKLNDQPVAAATPATSAPAASKKETPVAKPQPKPQPKPAAPSLAVGTMIGTTSRDTVTSQRNKAGETMVVLVANDVKDASGRVVIPAGSPLTLTIDTLKSESSKSSHNQAIRLTPVSVEIAGASIPVTGTVDSVGYILKGRGITAGTAAKVGVGAVAGGILGRLIGGNKTGTIVGGVAGAAAGAAVADKTGDQDITIYPGSVVIIRLTGAFSR